MKEELNIIKIKHLKILEELEVTYKINLDRLRIENAEKEKKLELDYIKKVEKERNRYQKELDRIHQLIRKNNINRESSNNIFNSINFAKFLIVGIVFLFFGIFLIIIKELKPNSTELKFKVGQIEAKLRVNYNDTFFNATKLLQNEKVKNEIGDYYKIDLKFANTKELVLFKPGKYYLSLEKKELIKSINAFREKVYFYLDQKYETKIYLKGTADITGDLTFSDTLIAEYDKDEGFEIIQIKPLDKLSGKYDTITIPYRVPKIYTNSHLPNLRARFLQKILEESNSDWQHPQILEGNVANEISEFERNAYLILFVSKSKPLKNIEESHFLTFISITLIIIGIIILIIGLIKRQKTAVNN